MPAPRLLVLEGNTPEARAEHVAVGGTVASEGYTALLQELLPGAIIDVCFPADAGVNLPSGQALEGYVLSPKLVGARVGLHPVWLMFSLLAFGYLFGFVGFLVAVPLAAAIGVLVRFAVRQYQASPFYTGGPP